MEKLQVNAVFELLVSILLLSAILIFDFGIVSTVVFFAFNFITQ
jgi:hypothetical protein